MSTEQIDFDEFLATLEKLFNANTPEESFAIIQQHPELLSEAVDQALEQLIHQARERGNEELVQLLSHHREMPQTIRQAIAEEKDNENNDMPLQLRANINQTTETDNSMKKITNPEMTAEEERKLQEQLPNVIRVNLPTPSPESQPNNSTAD